VILFHTINGLVAILSGLAIIFLSKGSHLHKVIGRVYVASMYVLCVASFAIQDTTPFFRGFGMFHVMALVSIWTVTRGLIPALYRRGDNNWYARHFSFMLWSYVGLIMALNSHFFRDVFLFFGKRVGMGQWVGLTLSIVTLWVLPPLAGALLINRRAPVYKRRFANNVVRPD